ncbi:fluoroquinolone export ABC transporter permease subunit [Maribellus maritimus]|uniref:fluoroquinolone export ABC transporter permease subunit n=1 Tax=Maribellus maritimus TaxID=2870838 RepID=UPI001EEAD62C|nr:ABC transporter permease [Maribellus maritimus]MCG6189679.1 ABC transporter permease [Maribellus maritimus]
MKTLFKMVIWDLKIQARNQIITVALIIAAVYTAIFFLLGLRGNDKILIALIFSDPTFMGFIFTGVLVLFEKSSNTLQALVVTPVKSWQYFYSKAISLTIISLIVCFAMIFASHGFRFNYFYFLSATFLSSLLFIFLGFIGVAKIKTFNQYIIVIPLFIAPFSLPYLNFFGLTNSPWLYLFPTQASFFLFEGSFCKITSFEIIYSFGYIILAIGVTHYFANRLFKKYIIRGE